ncbi:MAG: OprD family outer membrane porin, partial [Sulfuricurvum sp.]|nr:OprD family outer membrane porin [Sulfuricurvum sp.]
MKKLLTASLVGAAVLSASAIDESFTSGSMSGGIRLGYLQQNNEMSSDSYATVLGGIVKYETASLEGLKLGAAGYISQKVTALTGREEKQSPDFFDADGNSFVYLGEAYMDYSKDDLTLRVGRQLIETPFLAADDVRMLPNTFEGGMATYSGIDKTTLSAGYLMRWAGFDSPRGHNDSINEFKKFGVNHDSNGVLFIGITNQSIDDLALQGWVYSVDKVSNIVYSDALYSFCFSELSGIEVAVQYAKFDEKKDKDGLATGIDGSVY